MHEGVQHDIVGIGVRANIHLGGQTEFCPNGFGGGGVVAEFFRDPYYAPPPPSRTPMIVGLLGCQTKVRELQEAKATYSTWM